MNEIYAIPGYLTVIPKCKTLRAFEAITKTPVRGVCSATAIGNDDGQFILTADHCRKDVQTIVGQWGGLFGFYNPTNGEEYVLEFQQNRDDLSFWKTTKISFNGAKKIAFNQEGVKPGAVARIEHEGGNFPLLRIFDGPNLDGQPTFTGFGQASLNPIDDGYFIEGEQNEITINARIRDGASGALVTADNALVGIVYGMNNEETIASKVDIEDVSSNLKEPIGDSSGFVKPGNLLDGSVIIGSVILMLFINRKLKLLKTPVKKIV